MFRLVSQDQRPPRAWSGGAVSLCAHVLAAAAAIRAAAPAPASGDTPIAAALVTWPGPAPRSSVRPSHADPVLQAPSLAPLTGIPGVAPPAIEGLSPVPRTGGSPSGVELPGAVSGGPVWPGDPDAPWNVDLVDERPALLAGPEPGYPEALRRAGIEGRVVVEAVLDTLGRPEPRSVAVVASTQREFAAAARAYLLGARFRPARVHGRPVRVLVSVPIDFRIAPGR